MSRPIVVVGGGGHAGVVIDVLSLRKEPILGIVDPSLPVGGDIWGVPVLGNDDVVARYAPESIRLVNGIGSTGTPTRRARLFEHFVNLGYSFAPVIHTSAVLALHVDLGEGVQVMAGAVVQPGVTVGNNAIVNTKASVDHDCYIGDHVHIAPGATLCGEVRLDERVFIGSGAIVIPGVHIGAGAVVGAGSVVLKNVLPGTKVAGVPAKEIHG